MIKTLYKKYLENFDEGCFSRKWLKCTKVYDGFFEDESYEVFTEEEFKILLETNHEFNTRWGLPHN
jgi:hypothetical protein